MEGKLKVESTELKTTERYFLFILLFSLFTFDFSLSTSFAGEVHSRAAVAMDASTGRILYAKNPDLKCPPASTTKLMTAIVTIENTNLSNVVTISRNASLTPPHKAGLRARDRFTVEEMLYAALLGSANDAAVALAETVAGSEEKFVELMNKKAIEIGARDTIFINPHGLPGPGQHTTASDLAKIMNYALRYPNLKEIIGTRITEISTEKGKEIFLKNTNKLLWSDDDLVGGKTGYTHNARHCFVCAAERENNMVIVALLGSPSRKDLWKESEILIDKGFGVVGNKEEPVIYLAKADDVPVVKKAAYKKKPRLRSKKSAAKLAKNLSGKESGKHKKTLLAKKKGKTKVFAKKKTRKNYRIAKRFAVDRNKG